jgi:hypothetical protein
MGSQAERRIFPRRAFSAAVFAYENGARFVAHPVDLSVGGAFLATEAVERISEGDLVSVVFGPETKTDPAVFLFARVVRRQRGAGKGVGVEWTRAMTTGRPEHLAAFIERTFGVRSAAAQRQVEPGEGRFRCLFSFVPIQETARRHRETMDSLLASPSEAAPSIEHVRLAPARHVPGHLHISPTEAATDARGVITAELTVGNERAPVSLEASLRIDRALFDVRVVELGLGSIEVLTAEPVPESPRPAQVSLAIPGREHAVTVAIEGPVTRRRCIVGSRGMSLDVTVRLLDEGSTPGVWARFAKWCYFQSLRDSER